MKIQEDCNEHILDCWSSNQQPLLLPHLSPAPTYAVTGFWTLGHRLTHAEVETATDRPIVPSQGILQDIEQEWGNESTARQ